MDKSENDKQVPFSKILEDWLNSDQQKTIAGINNIFAEKTFAIAFLVLMSLPALPLPTGGVTHVFEVIAILLAIEMIIGRQSIWLPKRWQNMHLNKEMLTKTLPALIKVIRWFERFSQPRFKTLTKNQVFLRVVAVIIIVFTVFAFIAPPFSGLDTLPSFGIVLIALGLILYDSLLLVLGLITGSAGIVLIIGFAAAITNFFHHFFVH